ncbi:MAG TPA: hypothetical protein VNE16_07355 [Vicinamibacterales bacterium]|nr:hypothetical protein [Vicinamibacterales bacterium]
MRTPHRGKRWAATLLVAAGAATMLVLSGHAQSEPAAPAKDPLRALHFRAIGPPGNRLSAIVGVPGDPAVMYVGAADGGIFKTDDGGINWRPIFDHQDVSAIGALAIAPSAHNVVWAGTGETWLIRPFYAMGDGVYKSTDAGRSWQHMGLDETGHIARIVVDPQAASRVFVCALGQTFAPGQQQGVFRTLDGGKTWQRVLFVNDTTGCSDLAMDPQDPNTLFAGMWQMQIHTWNLDSGGTGSGVYVSHDGGATWKKLVGHGLPAADHPLGKVAVAIAPSNPHRVYALMQDKTPGLYRSNNGGRSWRLVNQSHAPDERAPYYTRFTVSPDNENLLYFVSVAYSISLDGGDTLLVPSRFPGGADASGQASAGGDNHDIWIDPTNPSRILVANDAGASWSLNHGRTFNRVVLPVAQMYHVATDNDIPYHVLGNKQDGPSYRGPSRVLYAGFGGSGITAGDWVTTAGCEDGFAVPDPTDGNIVWGGCDNGRLDRMDHRTGMSRDVTVWPVAGLGWAPKDMKYRWHWVFPIAISPFDHNRVYVGSQYVHETTDGGQTWKVISPDLTLNDKTHEDNSGGISYDNLVTYDGSTVWAIAESPVKAGVIWAGTNDGQVQVTLDGGAHWTNVTKNIPNLGPWGTVWDIAPSPFDAATAYVVVNRQHLGDYNTYVFKTTDDGRTWTLITGNIPKSVNGSAHCILPDPVRKGMLYLGTDNALYVSWDDGGHWTQIRSNLPPAPMYWMVIQPTFNDLVVATYGRGIYILDDMTPLRDYQQAQQHDVYLFKPRPAYRFHAVDAARQSEPGGHVIGENARYGADFNFWLKSPQKDVELTVLGPNNTVVRTLKVRGHEGLNRVWWDLRYESGEKLHLLTSPPGAPWVPADRPVVAYGTQLPMVGPIVPPGTYTVRLTVGAQPFSAPVQVLADPHSPGTPARIKAQVDFLLQVRNEGTEVADMINHLERTRRQAENVETLLESQGAQYAPVVSAAKAFADQAAALEGRMWDVHNTGRGEDVFRHPVQVYERLAWMVDEMTGRPGGGSGGADLGPTSQQAAVNAGFQTEIAQLQTAFKQFTGPTTAAFNDTLKQHNLKLTIEP